MDVVNEPIVQEFIRRHPRSGTSLRRWLTLVDQARWRTLADLKATFPSADYTSKGRTIFNIGGNRYRLIALVDYLKQRVLILGVLSHGEYDRGRW